jgi:hypothetical protein
MGILLQSVNKSELFSVSQPKETSLKKKKKIEKTETKV